MTAPRIWPGSTVVCIASGPSLTADDIEVVHRAHDAGQVKVIVINTTYQLVPWADCLYACDARWWKWHEGAMGFHGLKYSLQAVRGKEYGVTVLKNTGTTGLELDPSGLKTGHNSGYQAINLAVHFGATKIVLLGYEMQRSKDGKVHWHGDHRQAPSVPFVLFLPAFPTLVKPLRDVGVHIVNCSRNTALNAFPKSRLEDVLPARVPATALEMSL